MEGVQDIIVSPIYLKIKAEKQLQWIYFLFQRMKDNDIFPVVEEYLLFMELNKLVFFQIHSKEISVFFYKNEQIYNNNDLIPVVEEQVEHCAEQHHRYEVGEEVGILIIDGGTHHWMESEENP